MATKKQKREAAELKRKAFEEQLKADGLKAQKADQERQKKQREEIQASFRGEVRRIDDLARSLGVI